MRKSIEMRMFKERETGYLVMVEIWKVLDHYEITLNDEFYCSAESRREADDEIESMQEEFGWVA